jgi:hypothetical protein
MGNRDPDLGNAAGIEAVEVRERWRLRLARRVLWGSHTRLRPTPDDRDDSQPWAATRPQHSKEPNMSTFVWNGTTYPIPEGWSGLSVEDWYYEMESARDRIMHADELDLEPMVDADGDELDPEEVVIIQHLGFQSGGHFEAFRGWGMHTWATKLGENPVDVEVRFSGIARERLMAEKAGAMAGPGGGLSPVEGVALEQWAHLQASLASGADIDALLANAGIDRPRWDRVSAEWMARMSSDTTMAIATAYGNAFAGAGAGQYGGQAAQAAAAGVGGNVGAEPLPFERYVEILEATSAAHQRGQDANDVLSSFGLSALDWSNIGMYWSKKTQQEAAKYHRLMGEYSDKYKAKYA